MAAIWVLALLAAPPAFFYTCTPGLYLGGASGGEGGALLLGLLAGVGGLTLVGWLARGLYLDASGRPKTPTDEEAHRPISRLQARQPTEVD